MRLDRLLSHASGLSRAQARRCIRAGRVRLGGELVRDPARQVPAGAGLALDDEALALQGPRYLMMHKPLGVVCARRDDRHPSVFALLPEAQARGLHLAGRLDLDASGLLLLTDDGAWSHRLSAPRHRCPKRYRVALARPLDEAALARLAAGVSLRGERRPTRPAEVERLGELGLRLTLREGRYHQVKRMIAALGSHVTALHRESIGPLVLDPALAPGEWRALTRAERAAMGIGCGD